MPRPPATLPDPGSLLSEGDLADAARAALDIARVTIKEAAEHIGVKATQVTMALNVAKYPNRGHAERRALLQSYAGLLVEQPLFRVVKAPDD